jgi:proteasome lid subunit RPN8/RPN11
MRENKVYIKRSQLAYFRKLARANKKEILAFLVGSVDGQQVTVKRFEYPTLRSQKVTEVDPEPSSETAIRMAAHADNLHIVGTIHSHPNYWPVLSPTDHNDHIMSGHLLSGVCAVMNGNTAVFFWLADSSLPVKVLYVE